MMQKLETVYVFNPSSHGIFCEIYFPKKTAHQGTIFKALREGYDARIVRKYLKDNITEIMYELEAYPRLFDPTQYMRKYTSQRPITEQEAKRRIKIYKSPFFGWSMYPVDGVFFSNKGKLIEENTQVVRIMFKFQSIKRGIFKKNRCLDVLRAMLLWTIRKQNLLDEQNLWSEVEQERFIEEHKEWNKRKLRYVKRHFAFIAREVARWIDDCALFIFGYLVRQFSENVIVENLREEEIWTVSFFNMTVNVIQRKREKMD